MKRRSIQRMLILFAMLLLMVPINLHAGEPVCHILICCRSNNQGMKFEVNGQWIEAHDYGDIEQVRGILTHIKDAGINTVCIDMTNPSQWTRFWDSYKPMVDHVAGICKEMGMEFFLFIGAALPEQIKKNNNINVDDFTFWNGIAEKIWNTWAQHPRYRKYGYGDMRPMLIVFQPADVYWDRYNAEPEDKSDFLAKYHIGTTQVNDAILPGLSDGWGYRNYSQSSDGKVRFVSPNGGVHPKDPWYRISVEAWKKRVEWASKSEHYTVYGSYDDTCDAIHWGIADTKDCSSEIKAYPGHDPYAYYNIVRNQLLSQ